MGCVAAGAVVVGAAVVVGGLEVVVGSAVVVVAVVGGAVACTGLVGGWWTVFPAEGALEPQEPSSSGTDAAARAMAHQERPERCAGLTTSRLARIGNYPQRETTTGTGAPLAPGPRRLNV